MTPSETNGEAGSQPDATPVPAHDEALNAAIDAVEPERLLAGEDEATAYVDDAAHWTKVYAELLDFKRSLLTLAEHRVSAMDVDAGAEIKKTDFKVLAAEAARFERRDELSEDAAPE
jgi:hypothetical protein